MLDSFLLKTQPFEQTFPWNILLGDDLKFEDMFTLYIYISHNLDIAT